MKKHLFAALALFGLGLMPFSNVSAQMPTPSITADRVWATACPDTENTYAVYMAINNNGAIPIRVAAAESPSITTALLSDGACGGEALQGLEIPAATRFDMTQQNVAWLVEMAADYEAGAPFTLRVTLVNVESDSPIGDATLAVLGVPVLDEAPVEGFITVNAMSVWARPTVAAMDMDDEGEMDMDDEGEMDMDDEGEMDMDAGMEGMNMSGTSAVYMQITNMDGSTDFLIAGETNIPSIVEVHENIINENDVMMMRPVEGGIPIPADGTQELRPGGYHVMLLEPAPMAPGDTILLTLSFESGESVLIAAPVEDRMMAMMVP